MTDHSDRRTLVYALLRSFLDWLPSVQTATGRLQASATLGGPAPSMRRCGRCAATGHVLGEGEAARPCQLCRAGRLRPHGCRPCLHCAATGWLRASKRQVDDGEAEDPMLTTADVQPLEESHRRTDERRREHALVLRLEAELAGPGEHAPHWWLSFAEKERLALWARGSYRELRWCLVALAEEFPNRSSVFWGVEIYGEGKLVSARLREAIDETVDWIAERMPAEIRVPDEYRPKRVAEERKQGNWRGRQETHAEQRRARDEHIVRQHAIGLPASQIADVNALSERHVWRVLGAYCGGTALAGTAA